MRKSIPLSKYFDITKFVISFVEDILAVCGLPQDILVLEGRTPQMDMTCNANLTRQEVDFSMVVDMVPCHGDVASVTIGIFFLNSGRVRMQRFALTFYPETAEYVVTTVLKRSKLGQVELEVFDRLEEYWGTKLSSVQAPENKQAALEFVNKLFVFAVLEAKRTVKKVSLPEGAINEHLLAADL